MTEIIDCDSRNGKETRRDCTDKVLTRNNLRILPWLFKERRFMQLSKTCAFFRKKMHAKAMTTKITATIVMKMTRGRRAGIGCSIFFAQAMVCFTAMAEITKGKVKAAQLGKNLRFARQSTALTSEIA